jgi:mannonate dehydratase
MKRRDILKMAATAGALSITGERAAKAEAKVDSATRGMPSPIIKDIKVIATQPGQRLTVVKITTDQAGLYGYGCGTLSMRADTVNNAVEKYLKPLLVGRPADRIEDTWQMMVNSAQWRFGPVLNNAMSGVDEALWDIKGRQAGVPVYELLGGKCREAVETYTDLNAVGLKASNSQELIDGYKKLIAMGFRNIRTGGGDPKPPQGLWTGVQIYDPGPALREVVRFLEECRKQLGPDVGLVYDVHRKATPNEGVQFCKDVEHLDMFYVEDPFSTQDVAYYAQVREQCSTPVAMGEMFVNPNEWMPLVMGRQIDYIRSHISALGGVTPCRKQAAIGELMGVRTSWHGSPDISPIGHMANVHLDVSCYNTGIQEWRGYSNLTRDMFQGAVTVKNGYLYPNDNPGWGIEVDEKLAAKYPYGTGEKGTAKALNGGWGDYRWPDGTIYHP